MYEQRTSAEIERAYDEKKKSIRLQISGFFYIIDLESMIQFREDYPNRRRNIKRDAVKPDCVKRNCWHCCSRSWLHRGVGASSVGRDGKDETKEEGSGESQPEIATTPKQETNATQV